jgi:hypothetical protein
MRTQILKPPLSAGLGLLLTLPTTYFILISILKYAFGLPGLFNSAQPVLESWGIKESIGWNINLLILFGPLLALLLNISSILSFDWEGGKEDLNIKIQIQKKLNNWFVIALSGLCLLTLFIYMVGENCR